MKMWRSGYSEAETAVSMVDTFAICMFHMSFLVPYQSGILRLLQVSELVSFCMGCIRDIKWNMEYGIDTCIMCLESVKYPLGMSYSTRTIGASIGIN